MHALNSVWALFELIIPRTERPLWIHLPFLILFLALYLALAYVTKATQNFYTYGFLDPAGGTGTLVGYVFGILAGICVLFVIVWLLVWLRLWLTEKVLGMGGKLAGEGNTAVREKGGDLEGAHHDNAREPGSFGPH